MVVASMVVSTFVYAVVVSLFACGLRDVVIDLCELFAFVCAVTLSSEYVGVFDFCIPLFLAHHAGI